MGHCDQTFDEPFDPTFDGSFDRTFDGTFDPTFDGLFDRRFDRAMADRTLPQESKILRKASYVDGTLPLALAKYCSRSRNVCVW